MVLRPEKTLISEQNLTKIKKFNSLKINFIALITCCTIIGLIPCSYIIVIILVYNTVHTLVVQLPINTGFSYNIVLYIVIPI